MPLSRLDPYTGAPLENVDRNYNVFNIDLVYRWVFKPGSELSITYKDAAETYDQFLTRRYNRNFGNILGGPQNNSVSIKVLYYVDYLDLKKKSHTTPKPKS